MSRVVDFKAGRGRPSGQLRRDLGAGRGYRVVAVPIGYGDGYPRALSSRGSVLIRGREFPVVGRVCMDQPMVDIGQRSVWNADEVVLDRPPGGCRTARGAGGGGGRMIPYEVLVGLNGRGAVTRG